MKNIQFLVFGIFLVAQTVLGEGNGVCPLDEDFHRSYIGILLSPIIGDEAYRQIRISWGNERFEEEDMIFLFSHDSVKGFQKIYELKPTEAFGIRDTGIHINPDEVFSHPPARKFTSKCFKYYVAWFRGTFIRDINCLGIRPTWMADQQHLIENKTLQELFIPGSHGSGSYDVQGYRISDEFLYPSFKAQDFNILQQLLFGVRYLDIRVGYYPMNRVSPWWVKYNTIRMVPLNTVIDQVRAFLLKTEEFVIFHVREFPAEFDDFPIEHKKLFRHLWLKFENHVIPSNFNWDMPLSAVRSKTSRRLYLTLDAIGTSFLTSTEREPITQYWGDANDATVLYEHLNAAERVEIAKDDFTPKVSIAELALRNYSSSPTLIDLQKRADSINHNITLWYHKYWFDLANIVAVDFLQSSGIVDVAIRANKFRFTRREEIKSHPTCIQPYLWDISDVESMMNRPNVAKLLIPCIVDDAPEKIYESLALSL